MIRPKLAGLSLAYYHLEFLVWVLPPQQIQSWENEVKGTAFIFYISGMWSSHSMFLGGAVAFNILIALLFIVQQSHWTFENSTAAIQYFLCKDGKWELDLTRKAESAFHTLFGKPILKAEEWADTIT